ncbi:MAG: aKG-HExxH-type peptide beta-hydroxylase [Caulobacteraceae bacterium]
MDLNAPWLLLDAPPMICAPARPGWFWNRVRAPSPVVQAAVESGGLRLQEPGALPYSVAKAAEDLIGLIPSLSRIAEQSILAVHVLSAEPGFDVSHSEPRWRAVVFVSKPERTDRVGALRLAEGVIHEAMHLHLTNAEEITPLVNDFQGRMPSPWRAESRSYQGVLHALFVFTCLAAYFRQIRQSNLGQDGCRLHTEVRLSEIRSEMARLDISRLVAGLTARGAELAAFWHALAANADSPGAAR